MQINKTVLAALFFVLLAALQAAAGLTSQDAGAFGMAQSLNNAGRYREAQPLLERLHAAYPEHDGVAREYVKALGFGDHPDRALEVLTALEARAEDIEPLLEKRAAIFETHRRFRQARDTYTELLVRRPGERGIILKLGDLSFWMRDFSAAITWYEQAGLDPADDLKRCMHLADSLLAIERHSDAVALYRRIIAAHPDAWQAHLGLARSLQAAGNLTEAHSLYRELALQHPQNAQLVVALADISYSLNEYAEAERFYAAALRLQHDPAVERRYVEVLCWQQKYDQALSVLGTEARNNEPFETAEFRADILSWASRYDEAVAEYARLYAARPERTLLLKYAEALRLAGRNEEAIERYREYLGK